MTTATRNARAISIAILAMGGEGGGVLADWIVEVAETNGYVAQTTSVPGVAQRTGATIYYVEIFPEAAARATAKDPVLALMPVPGEVDVVIASELMEMGRAIQRGLVSRDRTTLIASTHRVYSMTERTALGDGRVNTEVLIESGRSAAKTFIANDYARIASQHNSVISAALLGALAACGALPFAREHYERAIRDTGVGVEFSLATFASGFERGRAAVSEPAMGSAVGRGRAETAEDIIDAGGAKCADYQDKEYRSEYLARLETIRRLGAQQGNGELLREVARHLALWMTYEDAARVADLKIRRTRFERVRQDSRAGASQKVSINDYLHPSVQEIADILPRRIGEWLLRSKAGAKLINGYTGNGRIVKTTSVRGFLMLYFISGQRKRRRKSLRFHVEQKEMEAWLALVRDVALQNLPLAIEVAQCPRLIKGYGDTHRRGMNSYHALIGTIETLKRQPDGAAILRRLREAALADDSGKQLADAMKEVAA